MYLQGKIYADFMQEKNMDLSLTALALHSHLFGYVVKQLQQHLFHPKTHHTLAIFLRMKLC